MASCCSRSRASAPGAGSQAATSSPRARKQTAQLAPMTPEPITAIYMSHDFELAHYSRERFVTPAAELYDGHETVVYEK